jgi:DNA-binding response OmpR family regulator
MTGPYDQKPDERPPTPKSAQTAREAPVVSRAAVDLTERASAAAFEDDPTLTAPDRTHYTVLLVEDNPTDARIVREMLFEVGSARFHLTHVDRLSHAVQLLGQVRFDAVLLDLGLPDARGLEAVGPINKAAPDVPIVVLSGMEDETLAVEAVQRGAQDYLVKGLGTGNVIARSIRYAIERKRSEEPAAASSPRIAPAPSGPRERAHRSTSRP